MVHTHSAHATAFAANGMSIPVYLTAHADEFGCEIPCAGFGLIGSEAIGKLVVDNIGASPACLLKNHGVFTIGKSGEAAVKTAVMVEDIARTVWLALARQAGRDPARDGGETAHGTRTSMANNPAKPLSASDRSHQPENCLRLIIQPAICLLYHQLTCQAGSSG